MYFYVVAEAILFIKRDERQDSKIPASRPAAPISKVAILRTRLCLPTSGAREQANDAAFRYCHHFSTAEIDQLAASASPLAAPIDTFSADGSNHSLNRYLVLQRNA